jgi:hypothetical protein
MTDARYAGAKRTANTASEQMCGESRTNVRSISIIGRVARALWPRKTDLELSICADVPLRSAQYLLAGDRGLAADAVIHLLTTVAGPRMFRELSDQLPPAVLADYAREVKAAQLRAEKKALNRKLEALERGDDE